MKQADYIVVGSGIAGLRAALELAKSGSVQVFCKGEPWQSNTRWAQGGIAAAMNEEDSEEAHLQDTLVAGDGLCFEPAARVLVEEGPIRIAELIQSGANFDRQDGEFVWGREGAHSRNRILHAGDATGAEIVRSLLEWVKRTPGIEILPHLPAVDLLVVDGRCVGICAMNEQTGGCREYCARAVLLATGGAGQIFNNTTNPDAATGDGVAMAARAGAELMDLEFFQFHPTVFHYSNAPRFLLTEALRGEGAVLKNISGLAFMRTHHEMADLAPRDIVSRAMAAEMARAGSAWVYLDATQIPRKKLRDRFPNIYQFLQTYNLDLAVDMIPVSPGAHYWMGGVRTGLHAETSIRGLFAAGEAACNGVHGANRLASNSLLEGLVFGARAGKAMMQMPAGNVASSPPNRREKDTVPFGQNPAEIRSRIQAQTWQHLGLIRNEEGIRQALQFYHSIAPFLARNLEELELLNLIECSKLIGAFALNRTESRGSHYREDYPSKNPGWDKHHSVLRNGNIHLSTLLED